MILALDTDILVHWLMEGAAHHEAVLGLVVSEVRERGARLGIVPQVLFEFMHVATDSRRFGNPLSMARARDLTRALWDGREVARIQPSGDLVVRTLDLMAKYELGRKRILDTALAATLEAAGVCRIATLNGRDYEVFPFLEIVSPG